MTHSSFRSLSFLHAFLFWGSAHEWFKKWSVSEPRLPRREITRRGGVWAKEGWATHEGSPNIRATTFMFSSSHIKRRLCISFMKGGERWQYSSTKQFSSSNRINAEVFNCSWKMRRVCGETVTLCETMMCTAAVAVCELENNIYRASHLASFITESHTPASPMKLGVNPSSASLFSPSPLSPTWSRLIPPILSPSLLQRTRKETLVWFKNSVTVSKVKVTLGR